MYDARLYHFSDNRMEKLEGMSAGSEKKLRRLLEKNLEETLGITLLAREYSTGRTHRGFIDALGIDTNGSPVIIEYKKKANENIITQGLFYLDWLLDHKAEFTDIVRSRLNNELAEKIEFGGTRLVCVAASFSRFDERAIMQIERNIELVKYELYKGDLLLLQSATNAVSPFAPETAAAQKAEEDQPGMPLPFQARLNNMNRDTEQLYLDLINFSEELGCDVSIRYLKHYAALQTTRNFCCIQPAKTFLKIWLNLDPEEVQLEEGFSRNVRDKGHHASGDLEIDIHDFDDLGKAIPFIRLAYQKAGGSEGDE